MHMEEIRKIIHIDMDAFYASIEQRDNKKGVRKDIRVLSGLWVLQEKVDTRVSTFSLPNHILFLGIYGIIELSKDERR